MWPAFPASDYYGTSVTAARHQAASALPVLLAQVKGAEKLLPTFTVIRWWGVVSGSAPAASSRAQRSPTRGLDDANAHRGVKLGYHNARHPTYCYGPDQPGLEPSPDQGVSDTGSRELHRSHLLARPRRLVVPPSRYVVRAAPTRRRDPWRQAALSFSQPLRRPGADFSVRADTQRLVAHPLPPSSKGWPSSSPPGSPQSGSAALAAGAP